MTPKVLENKALEWVLRIGVSGEFIGHAMFALQAKEGWIKYFTAIGISPEMAVEIMPYIGAMDLALGILVLIRPIRPVLLWMAAWGAITALARPISGDPIWDFIERFANWATPLALYLYYRELAKGSK